MKQGKLEQAELIMKLLTISHTYLFVILLFVQIVGSSIVLTQTYLPKYAEETVVRAVTHIGNTPNQLKSSITISTSDTTRTTTEISYVATIKNKKGIAYSVNSFLNYTFPFIFDPIWDFIFAIWLLFLVCIFLLKFAEVFSSITIFN